MPRKKRRESQKEPQDDTRRGFPIVGIGASAGGLPAFEEFFAHMPPTTESGMAFVLVQHLAPNHKSILAELVRKYTDMGVYEVTDGMVVRPNSAYIMPPNRDIALMDGRLLLMEPEAPRGLRLPIDSFFRSLAEDQQTQAICIILSGMGSDGTLGLKEIKGAGGMAMVQDLESAGCESMPKSAIATNLVDFVLRPSQMPERLIAYVAHSAGGLGPEASLSAEDADNDAFRKVFMLLRSQSRVDFTYYKRSTVLRRIERRMAVNQLKSIGDYVRVLQRDGAEVETLFRELLIGVTRFFRDPEAFEVLQQEAIGPLVADRDRAAPVRVWVPGCSTGEEAYSIAILIHEAMDSSGPSVLPQIFATDIDASAINQARAATYTESIAADVPAAYLKRYFRKENGSYMVRKDIRDMVVFAIQNVAEDPPFSRVDLVSCRNLLIYMRPELQKQVFHRFQYALNPGGFLFLGSSETVGSSSDAFRDVHRKWRLYQSTGATQKRLPGGFASPGLPTHAPKQPAANHDEGVRARGVKELAEAALLERHTPPSAIINPRGDVLYIHGSTGKYLEPAPGEASMNIVRMAREGLRLELSAAIRRAIAENAVAHACAVQTMADGSLMEVDLQVRPIQTAESTQPLYMVTFEACRSPGVVEASPDDVPAMRDPDQRIEALERELRIKEEYLQTAIQELEISSEELRSTNEEMESANEELQSTNEELETSREELQSVNEELVTVNAELQEKLDELTHTNNDMSNLLSGTGIGTVFVSDDLIVRRFTPSITSVINLIQADVGRPVGHIASNLINYDRLTDDIEEVLDQLTPKESQVQAANGRWYLMSIRPYRTQENAIDGAVITFADITELKQLQELGRLATVVRDSNDAITVQNLDGKIVAWNPGAERLYGWSEAEALDLCVDELVPPDKTEEAADFARRLAAGEQIAPYRTKRLTKAGKTIGIWLVGSRLLNEAGRPYAIATTECPLGPSRGSGEPES